MGHVAAHRVMLWLLALMKENEGSQCALDISPSGRNNLRNTVPSVLCVKLFPGTGDWCSCSLWPVYDRTQPETLHLEKPARESRALWDSSVPHSTPVILLGCFPHFSSLLTTHAYLCNVGTQFSFSKTLSYLLCSSTTGYNSRKL